jgi:phage terminase small subunit
VTDTKASLKQKAAVSIYINNGGNKLDAYLRAYGKKIEDYKDPKMARVSAQKCFEKPAMVLLLKEANAKAILAQHRRADEGVATAIEKYSITKERIMEELAKIGFANVTDVMTWGPDGVQVRPSGEIGEAAAAVSEVSETGSGEGPRSIRIKMLDKQQALINLGKELGMFSTKVDVKGQVAVAARFVVEGK